MLRALVVGLVLGAAGCGDDHGDDEPAPGEDACEHFEQGPIRTATAGLDAASAPATSDEHTRWDLTLVTTPSGPGGTITMALADEGEHVIFFDEDVDITITDGAGATITTTKATSDAGCARVAAAFTVDFSVGTYTIVIASVAPTTTEVSFVLVPVEGHDH